MVHARLQFTFGSTSSITGLIQWTNPSTPVYAMGYQMTGFIVDNGVQLYPCLVQVDTGTSNLQMPNAASAYLTNAFTSATVPMTWGTNDSFIISYYYEVA